jgi:hypothetical protein
MECSHMLGLPLTSSDAVQYSQPANNEDALDKSYARLGRTKLVTPM